MAEAGDPGVTAGKIAAAASFGPHHEFYVVTGRIAKADEGPDFALLGLMCGTRVDSVAKRLQRRSRFLQAGFVLDLEADGLITGIAFGIAQRMRARIGAEIEVFLAAFGNLQPETGRGKILGRFEVGRTEANVAHVL